MKIAQYLGISRSTLYRRLEEEGLSQDAKYTYINDSDLDRVMSAIKQNYPLMMASDLLLAILQHKELSFPGRS